MINFFAALCIAVSGMYPDSGNGMCITDNMGEARIVYAHNYTTGGGLIQNLHVGDSAEVFEGDISLGVVEVTQRYTTTGRMPGQLIDNDVLSDPQFIVWVTTDPEREAFDPIARIILIGVIQDPEQS
ncbi:MAG: hypothetical protein ABI835_05120 [Chloroflexota bacterium]